MPRLTSDKWRRPSVAAARPSLASNKNLKDKTMKREIVMPLVTGIILGCMAMIFWQFSVRLNNTRSAIAQLEQATAQNTNNVNDIVSFINQATGANQQPAPTAE